MENTEDFYINEKGNPVMVINKTKITFSINNEGNVSFDEELFFAYMSRVRGILTEFLLVGNSMAERIEYLKKNKMLTPDEISNIEIDKTKLKKACDATVKFNNFMSRYDVLRSKAYMYYFNMDQLNKKEDE